MGGAHGDAGSLHRALDTPIHHADAAVKIVCMVAFVLAVVTTPPQAIWAFGLYAAMLAAAAVVVQIPAATLLRRLTVELPFVVFALALPFVGTGPRHDVAGLSVSIEGSWAAWSILAKATCGTCTAVLLSWSTPVATILEGLDRLRVPRALTAIAGFMVRYLDLMLDDLRRLQIARISRGDDPRWIWQGRTVAATAGTLIVRSFERGERIQVAMSSRGFTGAFPALAPITPLRWWPALAVPLSAWVIAIVALVSR